MKELTDVMTAATLYARVQELEELAKIIEERKRFLKSKADSLLYNGNTDSNEVSK